MDLSTYIGPETILLGSSLVLLMLELFAPKKNSDTLYYAFVLSFVVAAYYALYGHNKINEPHLIFNHGSQQIKALLAGIGALVLVYAKPYLQSMSLRYLEHCFLITLSVIGIMAMCSANSLVSLYLSLELYALPSYALIAVDRKKTGSSEAAIKYFILGSLASAMLLYGFSILFGCSNSLMLPDITSALMSPAPNNLILLLGMGSCMAAAAFKLGLVPFHMWLPDVYQGSGHPITLYIASLSKIAAFVLAYKIIALFTAKYLFLIQSCLLIMAIGSIILSLVAMAQSNVKRLLAYSTISHMGYVTLGLSIGNGAGVNLSFFYLIVYTLSTLLIFSALISLQMRGIAHENLEDFKGLYQIAPGISITLLCALLSLAGIPPFIGFASKLFLLQQFVLYKHASLALFAFLMAVPAAYYYLRWVKIMFFEAAEEKTTIKQNVVVQKFPVMQVFIWLNLLALLGFSVLPNNLINWTQII